MNIKDLQKMPPQEAWKKVLKTLVAKKLIRQDKEKESAKKGRDC